MSYPNHPLFDPYHRRRRNHRYHRNNAPAPHSPLAAIATTAAVVYGAYRLGSWAWNVYRGDNNDGVEEGDDDEELEEEEEENDLLYEWTADHHHHHHPQQQNHQPSSSKGGNSHRSQAEIMAQEADSTQSNRRHSRRSREHWSTAAGHNKDRSHRPSPPIDYYHHSSSDGGENDVDIMDRHDNNNDNVVQKAASKVSKYNIMCTTGSAVSTGIFAGMRSYEQKNQNHYYSAMMEKDRALRMGRCRLEVSRAMMDFLPTLKQAVMKETDVSSETEELKTLRSQRKKLVLENNSDNLDNLEECGEYETTIRERERILWNDIKNKSVTRLVTTIYAHTIIFLMLTVQVNLLGGRLLRDEQTKEEDDKGRTETTANGCHASHQTVLTKTYHYLFARGIPILAQSVAWEVREILQDWDIFEVESATMSDVCSWLNRIRDSIEEKGGGNTSSLVKFVIPPECQLENEAPMAMTETNVSASPPPPQSSHDELATYILDETYDLLESPTFAQAEHQCLNSTFDQIQSKVLGKIFLQEGQHQLPLVNVVTHMQKSAVLSFHKPPTCYKDEMRSWGGVLGMMEEPLPSVPNDFISRLEKLESVRELSDVSF